MTGFCSRLIKIGEREEKNHIFGEQQWGNI